MSMVVVGFIDKTTEIDHYMSVVLRSYTTQQLRHKINYFSHKHHVDTDLSLEVKVATFPASEEVSFYCNPVHC